MASGEPERTPVLLELFTSEGCSSCPPAEEVLARICANPPQGVRIVPVAFHVDYWNDQGWRDKWSNPRWTMRQTDYQRYFGRAVSYTPQLVVDGAAEMVGSQEVLVRQKVLEAAAVPKVPVALELDGKQLRVHGPGVPDKATLSLFFVVDRTESDVLGGENRGRHLVHSSVATAKENLGTLPRNEAWERSVKRPNQPGLRAVAVLQDASTQRVLGVGDRLLTENP